MPKKRTKKKTILKEAISTISFEEGNWVVRPTDKKLTFYKIIALTENHAVLEQYNPKTRCSMKKKEFLCSIREIRYYNPVEVGKRYFFTPKCLPRKDEAWHVGIWKVTKITETGTFILGNTTREYLPGDFFDITPVTEENLVGIFS